MVTEEGSVIVEVDPVPAEELIFAIDPVELTPILVEDPAPVEEAVIEDAPVKEVPVEEVPVEDSGAADGAAGEDDLIFTTMIIDETGTEDSGTEDSGTEDAGTGETATEGFPVIGVSDVQDDGDIFITYLGEEATGEEATGEENPGRPVDPKPEWRTFDGETTGESEGSSDDGLIIIDKDIVFEDTVTVTEDTGTEDTGTVKEETTDGAGDPVPDDVIYTMNPDDPLIYATTSMGDTPGRSTDPLPFERNNTAPVADPAAPDTASDVVHYAASEPFHTGLDLL